MLFFEKSRARGSYIPTVEIVLNRRSKKCIETNDRSLLQVTLEVVNFKHPLERK